MCWWKISRTYLLVSHKHTNICWSLVMPDTDAERKEKSFCLTSISSSLWNVLDFSDFRWTSKQSQHILTTRVENLFPMSLSKKLMQCVISEISSPRRKVFFFAYQLFLEFLKFIGITRTFMLCRTSTSVYEVPSKTASSSVITLHSNSNFCVGCFSWKKACVMLCLH